MSIEIPVGRRGAIALVDESDASMLEGMRWYLSTTKHLRYAETLLDGKRVKMHRILLGLLDKPDMNTDHINGNGLDNRRINLRACKQGENSRNLHIAWGKSQNRGVTRDKNKWRARIRFNYHLIYIGSFDTEADAVRAYAFASRVLHGEFGNPIVRDDILSISESAGERRA